MKFHYNSRKINNKKDKIDTTWVIYKIDGLSDDFKLYKDPNYLGGYYVINNIQPGLISIFDNE